jgi:UDP-N-acetylglucosamine 2-epimerase (non-hydrolysing)
VLLVVGTRPNLVKAAPVLRALEARPEAFETVLVHTGQHYDDVLSRVFFDELGVRDPEHVLAVGSGSHARQTALVLERLEPALVAEAPDLVLVCGDVNSTLAAALAAAKLGIPLGHVEAGLRSFDRSMPEEVNRVVADRLSGLLFTHSPEARENLVREGADAGTIHEAGNTMIDTLVALRGRFGDPARHGVAPGGYVVVTLHRPSLVDGPLLPATLGALESLAGELPVVFPVHPRTRAALERAGRPPRVTLLPPLPYLDFMGLVAGAAAVLTDSGGIQEETSYLRVPCFTLRDSTERPVTVERGTNTLLGLDPARIADVPGLIDAARARTVALPSGWDGHAAERIAEVLSSAGAPAAQTRSAREAAAPRPA